MIIGSISDNLEQFMIIVKTIYKLSWEVMSPIYRTHSYTGGKGNAKLSGISHDGT